MLLKQLYQRFRDWQRNPRQYSELGSETHCCNNCGQEYAGSFCPRCGQKARAGRITWATVRSGLMDLFGLGGRSLPYSMWQLLWRPGYFISDYISGKCYASFAPVKMLFVLALIYSFIAYWFFPKVLHMVFDPEEESAQLISRYVEWAQHNYSWQMLAMAVLAIIPTYLLFRYAPRHTRHTLPEGFFIQVFFSVIGLVLSLVLMPLRLIDVLTMQIVVMLLTMFYYIVGYMQLFGYGLWGTLWRQGFIYVGIASLTYGFIFGVFGITPSPSSTDLQEMGAEALPPGAVSPLASAVFIVFGLFVLGVGYVINFFASYRVREHSDVDGRVNENP
jgi:hypothetical protein